MGNFYDRQAVFHTYSVGNITEFSLFGFGIVVFLSVKKGNRIKAEMIVQMVFVKVGSDDNLILIAPTFLLRSAIRFGVPVRVRLRSA